VGALAQTSSSSALMGPSPAAPDTPERLDEVRNAIFYDAQHIKRTDTAPLTALRSAIAMAPLDRAFSPASGFEFTATQKDSTVAVKASHTVSHAGTNYVYFDTFTATLSASAVKGADSSDVWSSTAGTLTQVELKGSRLFTHARIRPNLAVTDPMCNRLKKLAGKKPEDRCDPGDYEDYDKAGTEALLNQFWLPDQPTDIIGARLKFGNQKVSYFDGATLAKTSDIKSPWSDGLFWNHITGGASTLYGLSLDVGQAYKDQDSKILCPAGAGVVTCINGPIGAPKLNHTQAVTLEVRHQFRHVAIAPQISYDTKTKETKIDVPIYMITDGNNGLTGGVRFGWSSKDKDTVFGLFVTKAFTLLGN